MPKKKKNKNRNPFAIPAKQRKGGPMKDKSKSKKDTSSQREYLKDIEIKIN